MAEASHLPHYHQQDDDSGFPSQQAAEQNDTIEKADDPSSITDNGNQKNESRAKPSRLNTAVSILLEQWFLLALAALIALASQLQVPLSHQKLKQTTTSYLCISLIFLTTGATLDTRTLLANYARWRLHAFVQAQCYLMTSLVVLGVVSATAATSRFMDPGLLVGLVFQSCVATTISSNVVMTRQAQGNTALTVVQTTLGNFLGVFVTPALVVGYSAIPAWYNDVLPERSGDWGPIYRRTLMKLGLSIYVPMVVGQVLRNLFPKTCKKVLVDWKVSKLGSLCLLVMLWSTYDQAFATGAFDTVPASNKVFIVFISVALWILFFGIAFFASTVWLPRKDVVAICYCVPAKGIVMAVPLTTTIWRGLGLDLESRLQIPIVIYQGLQLAFASILVPVLRRWVQRGEEREKDDAAREDSGRLEEGGRTERSKA